MCLQCLTTSVLMWWWMEAQLTLDYGTLQVSNCFMGAWFLLICCFTMVKSLSRSYVLVEVTVLLNTK